MNLCSILGFIGGWVIILVTASMGGQGLGGFFDVHAGLIVVGGCTAAVLLAVNTEDILALPKMLKLAFAGSPNLHGIIQQLVQFSEAARRNGLLSLEGLIKQVQEPTLQRGLQMAIDGSTSEDVEKFFDVHSEIAEQSVENGKKIIEFYEKWAPSFGLLGTLQGLILMLQNLEDPETIAPSMGVAMVATFYGAFMAFMLGGPIANKIHRAYGIEHRRHMIFRDGVVSIQRGESPRMLEERLKMFLH